MGLRNNKLLIMNEKIKSRIREKKNQQIKHGPAIFVLSALGQASHAGDFFGGKGGNTTLLNTPVLGR